MSQGIDFPPKPHEEGQVTKGQIRAWQKKIALENHPDVTGSLPPDERARREEKFKHEMGKLEELKRRLGMKGGAASPTAKKERVVPEKSAGVLTGEAVGALRIPDQRQPIAEIESPYVENKEVPRGTFELIEIVQRDEETRRGESSENAQNLQIEAIEAASSAENPQHPFDTDMREVVPATDKKHNSSIASRRHEAPHGRHGEHRVGLLARSLYGIGGIFILLVVKGWHWISNVIGDFKKMFKLGGSGGSKKNEKPAAAHGGDHH